MLGGVRADRLAEHFLLELMEQDVWQPSDFDTVVLGGPDLTIFDPTRVPTFNRSIFGRALRRMVINGRVDAWQDQDGQWFYRAH